MNDLSVIIELILLLALPFVPIAVGVILRRKFSPAVPADREAAPLQGAGRRTGRFIGTFLLWSGILSLIFCGVVLLNYLGVL